MTPNKLNKFQKNKSTIQKDQNLSQDMINLNNIAKTNLKNTSFKNIKDKLKS